MTEENNKLIHHPGLEKAVFQRTPNTLHTEVDGEMVILDINSSKYSGLNELGTVIWKILAAPATFNTIRAKVIAEYDVNEEKCTHDLVHFLEEMLRNSLIKQEVVQIKHPT